MSTKTQVEKYQKMDTHFLDWHFRPCFVCLSCQSVGLQKIHWPVLSSLLRIRLPSGQWQDASTQLSKAEVGWGERLRVRQAAQVQRATEREQLSFPRHRGQEGGRLHARPALQPNDGQQRSDTRGESGSVHQGWSSVCCSTTSFTPKYYIHQYPLNLVVSVKKACFSQKYEK